MSSLTTLFVVGPEEYVEFNESMGSKAFLEHVWDQDRSPLKAEETSAIGSTLHSAGARISPTPPPRIEFPTVIRVRGKGTKYRLSGKYISWEELKQRNPTALKDPPSLQEFIERGSIVGTAQRLQPGSFLKGEKRFKIGRKPQVAEMDLQKDSDGWFGGASDSIYASKGSQDSIYAPKPASSGDAANTEQEVVVSKESTLKPSTELAQPGRQTLRKSRSGLSLSARLGMDRHEEVHSHGATKGGEAVKQVPFAATSNTPIPPLLVSKLSAPVAPPLSASCTPPETPMKGDNASRQHCITPVEGDPLTAVINATPADSADTGLQLEAAPLPAATKKSAPVPSRAARAQIDDMLLKVRQARSTLTNSSGGGSSESMWDPKKEEATADARSLKAAAAAEPKSIKEIVPTPKKALPPKVAGPSLLSRLGAKVDDNAEAEKPYAAIAPEPEAMPKRSVDSALQAETKVGGGKPEVSPPTPKLAGSLPVAKKAAVESHKSKGDETPHADVPTQAQKEATSTASAAATHQPAPEESAPIKPQQSAPVETSSDGMQMSTETKSSEPDGWSTIGNDTITSIDWADYDDDDDDLLDVPDDWGIGEVTKSTISPPATSSSPVANIETSDKSSRGRRGAGRKEKVNVAAGHIPREPRGMRERSAAESASRGKSDTSSLRYWERRKDGVEVRPGGGLKIAGAASSAKSGSKPARTPVPTGKQTQTPAEQRQQPKQQRKELFPQSAPPRNGRSFGRSSIPPNSIPLDEPKVNRQQNERPRISTNGDSSFARMTKGAVGLSGKDNTDAKDLASRIDMGKPTADAKHQRPSQPKNSRKMRRPSHPTGSAS